MKRHQPALTPLGSTIDAFDIERPRAFRGATSWTARPRQRETPGPYFPVGVGNAGAPRGTHRVLRQGEKAPGYSDQRRSPRWAAAPRRSSTSVDVVGPDGGAERYVLSARRPSGRNGEATVATSTTCCASVSGHVPVPEARWVDSAGTAARTALPLDPLRGAGVVKPSRRSATRASPALQTSMGPELPQCTAGPEFLHNLAAHPCRAPAGGG